MFRFVYVFDATQDSGHAARVPRLAAPLTCRILDRSRGGAHDYAPTPAGL